jgi:hypothetical protein
MEAVPKSLSHVVDHAKGLRLSVRGTKQPHGW